MNSTNFEDSVTYVKSRIMDSKHHPL